MKNRIISIKAKLVWSIVLINALIFATVIFAVILLNISTIEINSVKSEKKIRESLIAKGRMLSENNRIAIRGLVEDNAFSAIHTLVTSTVNSDDDIAYGIFMDTNLVAWVHSAGGDTADMVQKKKLNDPASVWAATLTQTDHKEFTFNEETVIEFAAPVTIGGSTAGFIRYAISTRSLRLALKDTYEDGIRLRNSTIRMIVIIGVISFLITCILVWMIVKRLVSRPITTTVNKIVEISKGDLSVKFDTHTNDEIGLLGSALNTMANGLSDRSDVATAIAYGDLTPQVELTSDKDSLGIALKEMIDSLNGVISVLYKMGNNVASGAKQFSDLSRKQLDGTVEQIRSLDEIVTSMSSISMQTKTNADSAEKADSIVMATSDKCSKGLGEMSNMVEAMNRIIKSSEEIERIINTIDEIAFQTNLLALNASIEAANAGKRGKGFAVVAQEVRRLSASCTQSAQETSDLIQEAIKNIQDGNKIAHLTSDALVDISSSVANVAGLISEISTASQEQAYAITTIDSSILKIDEVTRKNKIDAQTIAEAASTLSIQATKVDTLLKKFKLRAKGPAGYLPERYDEFDE